MEPRARRSVPFVELRMPTWRYVLLCISLCCGLFLSLLDTTIVATAIFTIGEDLGCLQSVTWVALSYTLSYVGCTVIFARLGDIFGRRNAYLAAGIIFLACSIGCGFCRSLWQLIVLRALQGVGGSGLYSLTLIILPEISPLSKRKCIGGLGGLVIAISGVLGPVLGGLITKYASWQWIFWIQAPIGITPLIVFCIAWPKEDQMRHARRRPLRELDFIGGFMLISASVLLVFAFQQGGIEADIWGTGLFIIPLILSFLSWACFFGWEIFMSRLYRKDEKALLFPVRLMLKRIYMSSVISTLLIGFPYYIVIYTLPLYFQVVYGKTALGAGVGLLPLLGCCAVATMLGGLISEKKDHTFATLFTGSCLMVIGCGLLSTLSTDLNHEPRAYAFQIFIGLGFGLTLSTTTLLATVESERKDHAVAQGIVAQVRMLGGSIGIAVSTAIVNMTQRAQLMGIVTTSELASLSHPRLYLTQDQMLAFRNTSADAFDTTLRICIVVAFLGVLATFGMYSRNPVDMAERRQALAMDAIMAVQQEEAAAAHKAWVKEGLRRHLEERHAYKNALKEAKKRAKAQKKNRAVGGPILITGTTAGGIGAETAVALAHGHPKTLLLLGRDPSSTEPVIHQIRGTSPETKVEFIKIHLDDLASVRSAAAEVKQKLGTEGKIDIMINNAAIIGGDEMEKTKDGWESCWGVNHLGHFLLTGLLLDRLAGGKGDGGEGKGEGGRVVNVSSTAFEGSKIFWGDVNFEDGKTYDRWASYGQSKLANMLFTTALVERYGGRGITALSVHPGVINGTGLAAHIPSSAFAAAWANVKKMEEETGVKFRADPRKTKEQGCATTLVAALEPTLIESGKNGAHLRDCNIFADVVPHAKDKGDAERLWGISEEMVGEKFA